MLAYGDHVVLGLIREHVLQHFKGHHIGLAVELDQEDDSALLGVEVQLLGLDIDIAGQNIVQDDILDKGTLVILLIVQILDIAKRNGQQLGHLFSHLVLTLNEYNVLCLGTAADRTVSITGGGHHVGGISKLIANALLDLADLDKLGASNNDAVFVNDADHAIDRILHLVNHTLEQSVRHNF